VKLVHAADLHLDSPLLGLEAYDGAPAEKIRCATRRAFQNLVSLCIEEDAKLLLIAGDVFDGDWRDYSTGLFFSAELGRLAESGAKAVLVRGNHDAASVITKHLVLSGHVIELSSARPETRVFDALGVAVHGQSFRERAVTDDLAARYPPAVAGALNVGLLHTALTGREGHHPYAPCTVETLAAHGYDYWALGHVHRREVVHEAPFIVFPGNLQGRHMREMGAKGATLLTVEDGRIASVDARALDVFRFGLVEVDAEGAANADDVVALSNAAIERALRHAEGRSMAVRVVVRGATRAHAALVAEPERWESQIRLDGTEAFGDDVWIERVRIETAPHFEIAELARRTDAIGQVARAVRAARQTPGVEREILSAFDELRKRLPADAKDGPDPILFEDPSFVDALFDDVERMLLPELFAAGVDE
jgi:DNA repair exonuclease SbcCD nuclease subunit